MNDKSLKEHAPKFYSFIKMIFPVKKDREYALQKIAETFTQTPLDQHSQGESSCKP